MLISEAPRGTYLRFGDAFNTLYLMCLGSNQVIAAMPGKQMTRGENKIDVEAFVCTHEEFLEAVNKADHKGDWYSTLLAEAAKKEL